MTSKVSIIVPIYNVEKFLNRCIDSLLKDQEPFDVIIANINRNILLNDMKRYVSCMHPGSELYMSGFYVDDIPVIQAEAEHNGLRFVHHKEKNRWAAVKFVL